MNIEHLVTILIKILIYTEHSLNLFNNLANVD